jgi:hypothetical protein
MKKPIILFLYILLFSFAPLIAQNDTVPDNSYYFDDGGFLMGKIS